MRVFLVFSVFLYELFNAELCILLLVKEIGRFPYCVHRVEGRGPNIKHSVRALLKRTLNDSSDRCVFLFCPFESHEKKCMLLLQPCTL